MFSIPHIVIIFIVVLVVFGPHKLPELARGFGKLMAEFRKASTDFKMAFEEEMRTIERQAREAEWKKSQEAAVAAATEEAQPATLATPPGSETAKILPESVEVPEPTITPVSEAVSRESHTGQQTIDFSPAPDALDGGERITEATPPEHPAEASSQNPPDQENPAPSGDLPAHDQRQPA